MRDPKRIPIILAELQKIWEKQPDLRLGQLIFNAGFSNDAPLFYCEDESLMESLRELSKDW